MTKFLLGKAENKGINLAIMWFNQFVVAAARSYSLDKASGRGATADLVLKEGDAGRAIDSMRLSA